MKNDTKRVSYKDLANIAGQRGIKFQNLKLGLTWAAANGYKVTDKHNRLDDADRQMGVKL